MTGFWLLMGHLLGDYILQNDWMAGKKSSPLNTEPLVTDPGINTPAEILAEVRRWLDAEYVEAMGHTACTVHCLVYTLAVWACSFWWMPWWGLAVCFAAHWPMDRFRLAGWWMRRVSGQAAFADKMGPWSVILVDNTVHLLTLGLIALAAGAK